MELCSIHGEVIIFTQIQEKHKKQGNIFDLNPKIISTKKEK